MVRKTGNEVGQSLQLPPKLRLSGAIPPLNMFLWSGDIRTPSYFPPKSYRVKPKLEDVYSIRVGFSLVGQRRYFKERKLLDTKKRRGTSKFVPLDKEYKRDQIWIHMTQKRGRLGTILYPVVKL
jgi:hypothetical protein